MFSLHGYILGFPYPVGKKNKQFGISSSNLLVMYDTYNKRIHSMNCQCQMLAGVSLPQGGISFVPV